MKISIIGAGNVGATAAQRIFEANLADVVLLDIAKGVAQGKALDLLHAAPLVGSKRVIVGTDDYSASEGSDVVVMTAGFPRQPGMSRSDLIARNGDIVKKVVSEIKRSSPQAILIIVTNPLDVMTYLAYRESGFERERVMGMAGALDSSRFAYIIAKEMGVEYEAVETMVLGQHGPDMVPLISRTRISGKPIRDLIAQDKIDGLTEMLRESGSGIVKLLGKGSAFYAPSAAIFDMIKAIAHDEKRLISVSCIAQGEYGLNGVNTGLPVKLGKNGIDEIVKLDLDAAELESLKRSADAIRELIAKV